MKSNTKNTGVSRMLAGNTFRELAGEKSTTHKSGNLDEMRSDKMPVLTAEGDQREVLQEINVAIRLLLGSC